MKQLIKRYMHRRERSFYERDSNRVVRLFEWGLPFVSDHVNGDDPRDVLRRQTENVLRDSERFYALPAVDDFALNGDDSLGPVSFTRRRLKTMSRALLPAQ